MSSFNKDTIRNLEQQLRIEKQALFDSDPVEFCRQNGMELNSLGVTSDFRNTYLYCLYPFDPASLQQRLPTYEEFVGKQVFPVGIGQFLKAKIQPEALKEINRIIDEINRFNGSMDEATAKSYYDKLEQLCNS